MQFSYRTKPSCGKVDEAGRIARENNCDVIIGLGGGSAMDAAKAIATIAVSGLPIHEYIRGNFTGKWRELLPIQKALPIVTIPTLAGTHPLTSDDIFRIYTAVYE
jgi:butanol dehydrogenase